jgi:hypothetical protein
MNKGDGDSESCAMAALPGNGSGHSLHISFCPLARVCASLRSVRLEGLTFLEDVNIPMTNSRPEAHEALRSATRDPIFP